MISSQTTTATRNTPPKIYLYHNRVTGVIHIYDAELRLYRYGNMTEQNALDQFRTDTKQQYKQLRIVRVM